MKTNSTKHGFFHNHILFKNAFQYRITQVHKHQQHFITYLRRNIDKRTRIFLLCGTISGMLFVFTFIIAGISRVGYDSFRFPISSLSIGTFGWIQRTNFIVSGLCLFAFAIGLRNVLRSSSAGTWGPLLIGLVAIGLIGSGIFSTDPVYGYPTTIPLILDQYSVHGRLHTIFSMLVFICLPLACFVFCHRFTRSGNREWAIYSIFTGLAMPLTFILSGMGFNQYPILVEIAGLFQRLSVIIGWSWITLLSLYLLSTSKKHVSHARTT